MLPYTFLCVMKASTSTFWIDWINKDPFGYCRARAAVSQEDARAARKRFLQGKISQSEFNAARTSHEQLLNKLGKRFGYDLSQYAL